MRMQYKGYTQGNTVILAKPLPVPDGTEVAIVVAPAERSQRKRGKKTASVTQETFGLIPPLVWAIGLSGVSLLLTYATLRKLVR